MIDDGAKVAVSLRLHDTVHTSYANITLRTFCDRRSDALQRILCSQRRNSDSENVDATVVGWCRHDRFGQTLSNLDWNGFILDFAFNPLVGCGQSGLQVDRWLPAEHFA